MQRPGLTTVGDSIIAGFGGHCDGFNFTGMLVAVSKTSVTVTSVMAMDVSPGEYNLPFGGQRRTHTSPWCLLGTLYSYLFSTDSKGLL